MSFDPSVLICGNLCLWFQIRHRCTLEGLYAFKLVSRDARELSESFSSNPVQFRPTHSRVGAEFGAGADSGPGADSGAVADSGAGWTLWRCQTPGRGQILLPRGQHTLAAKSQLFTAVQL